MVANVELLRRTMTGAIVVPQEALVRVEQGFVVFVVEGGGSGTERVVATPVQTGAAQQNRVSITSGLEVGDRVVVVGQSQVANGDRVRVVNAGAGTAAGERGGGGR
jgi:multidrug efflux system membrane fusion protein